MRFEFIPKRFALLKSFTLIYLLFSTSIRVILYILSFEHIEFGILKLLKILGLGFLFDLGSLSYILALYSIYLLVIPSKLYGSKLDKAFTYTTYFIIIFTITFTFLAELTFWDEYQRRFNFIAIDYLVYTYEVIANINQSYPLPLVVGVLLFITISTFWITKKRKVFETKFESENRFLTRLIVLMICFSTAGVFHFFVKNTHAEVFENVNENELAKSGIYSFFAAFKSHELSYSDFYQTLSDETINKQIIDLIKNPNDSILNKGILRCCKNTGKKSYPNVIFVGMESMNASNLERFGSKLELTPATDSIMKASVAFSQMYATGTRTVRGLEALSLCIPPTPGRSIVKRQDNDNLFTVGEVFKQKGYSRTFITGGDGLFDNMANYFSNNGFDIIDRSKDFREQTPLKTTRTQITDDQITFENAWGACDEDIYNVAINKADQETKADKPFFIMLMTNSNHRPYTFPDGIIDTKCGNRKSAIAYADKTFGNFIEKAKKQEWFKNTVFVMAADHCAYSAGRSELNIKSHHIPAFIYNLPETKALEVDKLCSQIDLFPTLFGYLNWDYQSNLFGVDVNKTPKSKERAFIGNHRKIALLKNNTLTVLETPKKHKSYIYNIEKNKLKKCKTDTTLLVEAISYYQSAFEMYKNGVLSLGLDESITSEQAQM